MVCEFCIKTNMGYTKEFKLRYIKHAKMSLHSIEATAKLKKVSFKSLYQWVELFEKYWESALENRKTGAKETVINQKFEQLVVDSWNKRKRSAHKLWIDLKVKVMDFWDGFNYFQSYLITFIQM